MNPHDAALLRRAAEIVQWAVDVPPSVSQQQLDEAREIRLVLLRYAASPEERAPWIPVGERLPSPHTDNEFICASRTGFVTALRFGESGWYVEFEDSAKDGYWNGCVTHWQPLPAFPSPQAPKVSG